MKKNVASQKVGAQMVSATDGSAFTGSVTVYVTGDAGTQAAGSVGSGACTHEGNGYHTYAPAQAETNYDLVAFTFTGTGAIPATVQVYTAFPQTGDSYALASSSGVAVNWNAVQNPGSTVNLSGTTTGTVNTVATGGITAGSIAADAIGASELAADAVAEIADAVWDEATSGHTTSGTFGEQCKTDIDAILADTGTDGVALANDSITAAKIANGAIDATAIASGALLASKFGVDTWLSNINSGTIQSATATTAVLDASADDTNNDIYVGSLIVTTGGTGPGQVREITDYVAATQTATVATWTVTPDATTTYAIKPSVTSSGSAPSAATVAAAVWDLATSGHTSAGTFGEQLKTDVDAILADTAELQTDWVNGGRLDLLIDSILADTNELQTDWANGGRLDLLIDAILADTAELQTDWVNGGRLDLLLDATLADTNELQGDWANGGRLDLLIDAILDDTGTSGVAIADGYITAAKIAADAIGASELAADAVAEIADAVLIRNASNTEGTAGQHSLTGVILAMMEHSISGTTLTIKKTDGSTTFATKTLTTDGSAEPITGIT